MPFLAPLRKVIEFCGKCKRPMAGNYPVCMNRSCLYFNKDSSERQEMEKLKPSLDVNNPHIDPIMNLGEFEKEPNIFIFPISHEKAKEDGVPKCRIEVLWKKGKMEWLVISFPNVPYYLDTSFQLELPNSETFSISGEFLEPISGWCADHKTQWVDFSVYGKTLRIHKQEKVLIEVK